MTTENKGYRVSCLVVTAHEPGTEEFHKDLESRIHSRAYWVSGEDPKVPARTVSGLIRSLSIKVEDCCGSTPIPVTNALSTGVSHDYFQCLVCGLSSVPTSKGLEEAKTQWNDLQQQVLLTKKG